MIIVELTAQKFATRVDLSIFKILNVEMLLENCAINLLEPYSYVEFWLQLKASMVQNRTEVR